MKLIAAGLVALFACAGVLAHSGGTDKNGCHHDRSNGSYHCH
ncbi:MAG: YHYH domain-containing protein [Sphingobacteriales bacterium]|nr:MAG: YHYH domain-containing protein [Sphingobacteriales bacterium]